MTTKRFYAALAGWISEEDVRAIRAEKFTLAEVGRLSKLLGAQFREVFTELGLGSQDVEGDLVEFDTNEVQQASAASGPLLQ